jgi:zinc protease
MLRERKVVIQEAILRTKENTTHRLRRSMARTMFGRHALARSTIGTPASIRRIEPAAALSFFDTYYNPTNATLVVTGKTSRADVIRLVDRYFARYAKGTPAKRTWRSASGWGPATTTIVKQNKLTRQPKVIIYQMFDVSALAKPDLLEALPMLRAILASSMPEGLESALIYDNYIASGVHFGLGLATDGWVQAAFHAVPADGIAPKRVAEAYFAALAKLNRSGISAATLKRAKRRAAKRYRRLFDRVSVRASHAAYWAANGITPPGLDAQIANTRRIKLAHINQLVAALASARRTVIGYALPQHKGN